MINRNGGAVTIIKVNDYAKQTDKYLVFQDGKLIIPGNHNFLNLQWKLLNFLLIFLE